MKIIKNACYGGFGFSNEIRRRFRVLTGEELESFDSDEEIRTNPLLVKLVEELGTERASDKYACLVVVDIPDDVEWEISDYDGYETIEEVHRKW